MTGFGDCSSGGGKIEVYIAHHGTAEDGDIPHLGQQQSERVFNNDVGWKISLGQLYLVTHSIELVPCGGGTGIALTLPYGQYPENFIDDADQKSTPVAVHEDLPEDSYCEMVVTYAPYDEERNEEVDRPFETPVTELFDNTVRVEGLANKSKEDQKSFRFTFEREFEAIFDISRVRDGEPLKIDGKANMTRIVLSHLYDRFFDDVDFSVSSRRLEDQIQDSIFEGLENEAYVSVGAHPTGVNSSRAYDDDDDDDDEE